MVGKWPLMIDINKGITLSSLSFMPYNPWKRCCVYPQGTFFFSSLFSSHPYPSKYGNRHIILYQVPPHSYLFTLTRLRQTKPQFSPTVSAASPLELGVLCFCEIEKRMDMALGLLLITRRLKEKRTRAPKMSYFQGNQFLLANEAARKAALLLRAPRDRMLNSNKARVAHKLWSQERNLLALLIQNRVSEVFAVDIHPGARIGRGILLDHATGVVAGETAVIGNNISILHNVTMGGTGKA
ncbi:hypothetical protein SAY86_000655 [Trapa natans]|uniref:Serine acetyltransferase n=1 Tax=Trapa natans TaxID=22666 RepID=A0AAN7MCE9_TRANT|nr:hypothetical protein SAY86_000655 [Trapa natans]